MNRACCRRGALLEHARCSIQLSKVARYYLVVVVGMKRHLWRRIASRCNGVVGGADEPAARTTLPLFGRTTRGAATPGRATGARTQPRGRSSVSAWPSSRRRVSAVCALVGDVARSSLIGPWPERINAQPFAIHLPFISLLSSTEVGGRVPRPRSTSRLCSAPAVIIRWRIPPSMPGRSGAEAGNRGRHHSPRGCIDIRR